MNLWTSAFVTVVLDTVVSRGFSVMAIISCVPYLSRVRSFQVFSSYCIFCTNSRSIAFAI